MTSDNAMHSIEQIQKDGTIKLSYESGEFTEDDIHPIPVDGVSDLYLYYDPIIAASVILPGDPIPIHHTDYTYYVDAFRKHTIQGEQGTLYDKFVKSKLLYVHEVQHWLRNVFGSDDLKMRYKYSRIK